MCSGRPVGGPSVFLHSETFCVTFSPTSGSTSGTGRGAFGLHSPFMYPALAVASGTHLAIQADTLLPLTAPTLSCLNPKLMDHSLLSQVAVSVLNPKSGLRVTVVCIDRYSLAGQHIWDWPVPVTREPLQSRGWSTPCAGLCVKPYWSSANWKSLEQHFRLTLGGVFTVSEG